MYCCDNPVLCFEWIINMREFSVWCIIHVICVDFFTLHCCTYYISKGFKFSMCIWWYTSLYLGCVRIIIKNVGTNSLMKNYEMPTMDSLLFLIVELLYLVELIVAHDRQCHKSSYIKSITSVLLKHKIFIYNYWVIPYISQRKNNHFQVTWTSYFQCCLMIPE